MIELRRQRHRLGRLRPALVPASGPKIELGKVTQRIGQRARRARRPGGGDQTLQRPTHPIELFVIEEAGGGVDQLDCELQGLPLIDRLQRLHQQRMCLIPTPTECEQRLPVGARGGRLGLAAGSHADLIGTLGDFDGVLNGLLEARAGVTFLDRRGGRIDQHERSAGGIARLDQVGGLEKEAAGGRGRSGPHLRPGAAMHDAGA